jgi:hypothetical protein
MTDQGAVSQAALQRLMIEGASQGESASAQLAMTPYEYGTAPRGINPQTNPTHQDAAPAAQRLAAPVWQGKTGTLNNAQAAEDSAPVWVTVPVDKVTTTPSGASHATPVYASTKGYVPRPGESGGSIPPPQAAGHPY